MATSLARQFFEKAVAGGSVFLKNLVTEQQVETEWLDFKGVSRIDDKQMSVNWSKFICGFANNEGGVVVWGIDARKDSNGVDCACGLSLSADPALLRSRLQELHPRATDPPLKGVESVAIHETGDTGPGFVVSYVPESDVKPHRAELMDNKPYYLRVGDSFHNPSPSLLRNLFFPRSSTKLRVSVQPDWQQVNVPMAAPPPRDMEIIYRFHLHNAGIVTARDIFLIIETEPEGLAIETPFKVNKAETEFGTGIDFPRPLHPSSNSHVCAVRYRVAASNRTSLPLTAFVPQLTNFAANFTIYAADMQPSKLRVEVGDRDLDLKRKKWFFPILEENG